MKRLRRNTNDGRTQLALLCVITCAAIGFWVVLADPPAVPVGHWPLDEGSGTYTTDATGNGNVGVLQGEPLPVWTSGVSSNALAFDGVQNEVVVVDAPVLSPTNGLTLTAWVKAATNLTSDVIGKWSTNATAGSYILSLTNGCVALELMLGGQVVNLTQSGVGLADTNWHHVAGSYDGAVMQVFLDGVAVTNAPAAGAIDVVNDPLRVGLLAGQLDDVRLYDVALTTNAIAALYHADSDGDGLSDWAEANAGLNPNHPDTDGDGINDALDPKPLDPLSSGIGLTGRYYNSKDFTYFKVERTDATVNFSWSTGIPASGVSNDNFSVYWQGRVEPRYTETYTFTTVTDDGVRLWVNDQLLINAWSNGSKTKTGMITLTAGQKYTIRMQFYESTLVASAKLSWSSASQTNEVIPQSQLYPPLASYDSGVPSTPGNVGVTFRTEDKITLAWMNSTDDLWVAGYSINRDGNWVADLATNTFVNTGLATNTTYSYTIRAYDGSGNLSAPSATLVVKTVAALPVPWSHADLGSPALTGAAEYNLDWFTVIGSGLYLGSTADYGHWAYAPMTGDGEIVARVVDLTGVSGSAKAGVMIRESLSGNARMAFTGISRSGVAHFHGRPMPGSNTVSASTSFPTVPAWVKVVRQGTNFTGYVGTDGIAWTMLGSCAITMSNAVYAGLADTSAQTGSRSTGVFANVTGGFGPAGAAPTIEITAPTNGTAFVAVTDIPLTVNTSAGSGSIQQVDYYQDDLLIGSATSSPYSFTWKNVPTGVYTVRARIVNSLGYTAFSTPVTVTVTASSWAGLRGEYYDNSDLTQLRFVRMDPVIDFNWGIGSPDPSMGTGDWSVRWIGKLVPDYSETYTLSAEVDDGVRLYLNGQLLINDWTTGALKTRSTNVTLTAGQAYNVTMEMFRGGSPNGVARLSWSSPSQAAQRIPFRHDADGDGLFDDEEAAMGTNPNLADTDGDGLSDYEEARLIGTNPLQADSVTAAVVKNGVEASAMAGTWQTNGTELACVSWRGYVEYQVATTTADIFRLVVEARDGNAWSTGFAKEFPLILSVDGEVLSRPALVTPPNASGTVNVLTPFLLAGTHTVRVFWDNVSSEASLQIKAVTLQAIAGADSDGNGVKDWADQRLALNNGIVTGVESYVSPACLEGRGLFLTMSSLAASLGGGTTNLAVKLAPHDRWYANVPLDATNHQAQVIASYENGGLVETQQVNWVAKNVLDMGTLTIRRGDSLLLTAVPGAVTNGTVTITIGSTTYTTTPAAPVPYNFATTGTYVVSGQYAEGGESISGSLTVKVIEHQFDSAPAGWVGKTRYWDNYNVPTGTVFEAEARDVSFLESSTILTNSGRRVNLTFEKNIPRAVVSRVSPGGPILDHVVADGFNLYGTLETYNITIEQYADGSRLVETMDILSPVLTGITVKVTIIVGGVTFDDGTIVKNLTAADFDALGQYKLRFLMGAGVQSANCHKIEVFEGSILIGSY